MPCRIGEPGHFGVARREADDNQAVERGDGIAGDPVHSEKILAEPVLLLRVEATDRPFDHMMPGRAQSGFLGETALLHALVNRRAERRLENEAEQRTVYAGRVESGKL